MDLHIPAQIPDDTIGAACAYAAAGWYVLPVRKGTKRPGSVVGDGWQRQSSRDPEQIVDWFAGTSHGIALHCGRSGALVLDVDHPDKLHPALRQAVEQFTPPYQATRPDVPGRGHYLFAMPEDRRLGNSLGPLGGGWGEIRGQNGVIIVAPTSHPEGGEYRWQTTGAVPALPGYVSSQLPETGEAPDVATDAQIVTFTTDHTTARAPQLTDAAVGRFNKQVAAGESRHMMALGMAVLQAAEAKAGLVNAGTAFGKLKAAFLAAVAQPPVGQQKGSRHGAEAEREWAGIVAWAVGKAATADPAAVEARAREKVPSAFTETAPGGLAGLIRQLREWQHLPDVTHVLVTLAVAATKDAEGEPAWLLLVGAPSAGKTESTKLLTGTADAALDEITAAGLLGWSRGKDAKPTGVLTRIGERGLITFGDLSNLLATSDRGGRDQVFALLRRIYDGHASRDVSPPGKVTGTGSLSWSGRCTVVGAVTGAIDRYTAHADQLGPRWVYVRLPDRTTDEKRHAAQLARRGGLKERRAVAAASAAVIVEAAAEKLPDDLPDQIAADIEDAALVTCWGRAAVPRSGYGRREIEGVPIIEEPMRLVHQLGTIAKGLLALGVEADDVSAIMRRLGWDSMPEPRRKVLLALGVSGEVANTSQIARQTGLHRHVAKATLEDLAAIGVLASNQRDEDEEAGSTVEWQFLGEDGSLIVNVAQQFHSDIRGGWHEKWV